MNDKDTHGISYLEEQIADIHNRVNRIELELMIGGRRTLKDIKARLSDLEQFLEDLNALVQWIAERDEHK